MVHKDASQDSEDKIAGEIPVDKEQAGLSGDVPEVSPHLPFFQSFLVLF